MKCLLCSVEIDELKEFPATRGPQGQVIEDIMGRWNHSLALNQWTHVALTAQKPGGSMSILSGHICPAHSVQPGSVALVAAPTIAASPAVVVGTPPLPPLKQTAPNAQAASVTQKGKEK